MGASRTSSLETGFSGAAGLREKTAQVYPTPLASTILWGFDRAVINTTIVSVMSKMVPFSVRIDWLVALLGREHSLTVSL